MEHVASIVCRIINKKVVPSKPKGRGRKGYGWLLIVRLIVYALLIGIFSNRGIKTHLENSNAGKLLGFKTIPNRTTIGRWRKKHWIFSNALNSIGNNIRRIIPTNLLIVDSTPIEDYGDNEGKWGHSSKGWFFGFKVHASVDQLKIPIRAVFTTGNKNDSPIMPQLLVPAKHVLGDAGYDSEENRKAVREMNGMPHIARNPRNSKKKYPLTKILKMKRYLIEQFNSLLKGPLLCEYWTRIKGFAGKASFAYAGIIAIQVMALYALMSGTKDLFRISLYRY